MIRSMTGYGKSETIWNGRRFTAEIRSVNHRYADISIRLPRELSMFEESIRPVLKHGVSRGKTEAYIGCDSATATAASIKLNMALAEAYTARLRELRDSCGLDGEPDIALVARFPDVFCTGSEALGEDAVEELRGAMLAVVGDALEAFSQMRLREGQALAVDISARSDTIKTLMERLRERAPFVAEERRERLLARIRELLGETPVDEARLLTEAALFADKCAVDEELSRLGSHMEQLDAILNEGGAAGKKLDFLVQEMNREANTIASKSNDLEMTRLVLDVKCEIEKIREQVQNIE